MLADGIYSVHFETLAGEGDGVVVVSGDKIRGGDATFAYFGTLTQTDNGFIAQLETKRHAQGRACRSQALLEFSTFRQKGLCLHCVGKTIAALPTFRNGAEGPARLYEARWCMFGLISATARGSSADSSETAFRMDL